MATLKSNQIKAATLLALGKTAREVAREINCTPETISHWKQDYEFEAMLNGLRWDALEAGREALRSGMRYAVEGLLKLVRDAENEETRRKACVDVLEMSGLRDPNVAAFGSGIGPRDAYEVKREHLCRTVQRNLFRTPVDDAVDQIIIEGG